MSVIANNIVAGAAGQGGADAAYQIDRSLRFNSSDSAYLSRTPSSAGNRKKFTFSTWVKRCNLGSNQAIFTARVGTSNSRDSLRFESNDRLLFDINDLTQATVRTDAVFRDPSAWYHIVVAVDTTQSTAADRVSIYVNGDEVTDFDASSYPSQDLDCNFNSAQPHGIGLHIAAAQQYLDAYLADVHFIDGQALDPTDFGEYDDNNVWQPKAYSGTYGTNGFHLDFSDNSTAAALGTDTSGNGNDWTPYNLQVVTGGPTSVASASGALPIYNTTDTYGTTKGTGTRTDSNSSSIALAVAMDGANGGTTFTDESATIKGSGSAKTVTPTSVTTSTAQSKFYGSSALLSGPSDGGSTATSYLTIASSADFAFGTGDFTFEYWMYGNALTSGANSDRSVLRFLSSDKGTFISGGTTLTWVGSSVLNGGSVVSSRWYHVAYVRSGGTIYGYLDGVQVVSGADSTNYGTDGLILGRNPSNAKNQFNGYIQDIRIYKGVAKYTSNFNPPSSTQNATIAAANDSFVDSPTNGDQTDTGAGGEVVGNYCTWNPNDKDNTVSYANGNLEAAVNAGATNSTYGTVSISSGKWYWEVVISGGNGTSSMIGVAEANKGTARRWTGANGWYYYETGVLYNNLTSTSYGASYTNGDVIGVTLDMDNGNLVFYKNGSSQGTAYSTGTFSGKQIMPAIGNGGAANVIYTVNFGQRPFAYTAPSGYKALCTANLEDPTIADGSTAMDVVTYTGNGSTQTISGLGFSPDLVWCKTRSTTSNHGLYDSVRGVSNRLIPNATSAESTKSGVTQFTSDGFTLGSNNNENGSGVSLVGWTWDAGTSTVSNTDGSITSTVRANASAGFSIVKWNNGGGGVQNVGHGLNATPEFWIFKPLDTSGSWFVYHKSIGTGKYLRLERTDAQVGTLTYWTPTATTMNIATNLIVGTSSDMVAYCFAPVDGYSSFGSYTGNGSADGPFVYTGFRPRWILTKASTSAGAADDWLIFDTERDTYNVSDNNLSANYAGQEQYYSGNLLRPTDIDILSNGFKLRNTRDASNGSGATFIYAAFAENPFKTARAR